MMNKILKYGIQILVLISTVYSVSSCGINDTGTIDAEFIPYVRDFEENMGVKVTGINIRFGNTRYPTIGWCQITPGLNEIEIDSAFWMSADDKAREQLLYHELGHCILYLDHDDRRVRINNANIEGSIMNTYFFGNRDYYRNYNSQYKAALKRNALLSI
jgi:hypothetical protein